MATTTSPYAWLITFDKIADASLRKLGNDYLLKTPDTSMCFYDLVALKLIDLAATKGIGLASINNTVPMHYAIQQWQVTCMVMLVAETLMGLNDVDVRYDKWAIKYREASAKLAEQGAKITYEMFLSAENLRSSSRAAARMFTIYN